MKDTVIDFMVGSPKIKIAYKHVHVHELNVKEFNGVLLSSLGYSIHRLPILKNLLL